MTVGLIALAIFIGAMMASLLIVIGCIVICAFIVYVIREMVRRYHIKHHYRKVKIGG